MLPSANHRSRVETQSLWTLTSALSLNAAYPGRYGTPISFHVPDGTSFACARCPGKVSPPSMSVAGPSPVTVMRAPAVPGRGNVTRSLYLPWATLTVSPAEAKSTAACTDPQGAADVHALPLPLVLT